MILITCILFLQMEIRIARIILVTLLMLAQCTSLLALDRGESSTFRNSSRSSGSSDSPRSSSHRNEQQRLRLPRRLPSRHNDLGPAELSKKTAHHVLAGGHLRVESGATKSTSPPDSLFVSAAGGGKERSKSNAASSDDEDKKTLSQQVKEGKYGLIQNELFSERPRRPGVLSYASNPEVPRDTLDNLGGLHADEIWLAENHVLVLKGAMLPEEEHIGEQSLAQPIDAYEAPRRQVKIPQRPRVPPPFPVQLTDGGPVQLLATNGSKLLDSNASLALDLPPDGFRGFLPGEGPFFPPPTNFTGPPDFYPSLPPNAVVVPPPPPISNHSDYDDEDQSIYYPPPYSFVYSQDNETIVPPGPLVPGIILPPPPDFFARLEDKTISPLPTPSPSPSLPPSSTTTREPPSTRAPSRDDTISVFLPNIPRKLSAGKLYRKRPSSINKPLGRYKLKVPQRVIKPGKVLSNFEPLTNNQVTESAVERVPWISSVKAKQVPLVSFYAATTPRSLEHPVETTPAPLHALTTEAPPPSHASYYYYDDSTTTRSPLASLSGSVMSTSRRPPPSTAPLFRFEDETATKSYLDVELVTPGPRLVYRLIPTRLQPKLSYFATTASPTREPPASGPRPIYQYSFEATNYQGRNIPTVRRPKQLSALLPDHFQDIENEPVYPDYGNVQRIRASSSTAAPPRDTTLAAHQHYFTQQDEQLLDEVTKEYFTLFGQKLPPSTTPMYPGVEVHYGDHTPGPLPSLRDDLLVNTRRPQPSLEPETEFSPAVGRVPIRPSLTFHSERERPSSYFAYRLPGDSGHFYFLTPQAVGPVRHDPFRLFGGPGLLRRRRGREPH